MVQTQQPGILVSTVVRGISCIEQYLKGMKTQQFFSFAMAVMSTGKQHFQMQAHISEFYTAS